jgi:microcin C transport system permease protein
LAHYLLKRILLVLPTLIGIMTINFVIIQFAPGGPVEQIISELTGEATSTTARISGGGGDMGASTAGVDGSSSRYPGARGLDPEFIAELEKQFGFDRPLHERYFGMLFDYFTFDFGTSYFQDMPVVDLVISRLPVSMSLGLWSLLITYLVCIPLGIAKAVRDGSAFDVWTSAVIFVGYAVPAFLFAIVLIVLFAGGNYFDLFPLRGLTSENWAELSWWGKITDYFWHLTLPLTALTIGNFAFLSMLTKNSFLDEINKQYVLTARAKGASEKRVLYGHVFRNALLIVIAGFPTAFVTSLYTGALLVEVIFSLDGIGLLGYEAVIKRDYPIVFGTLFMFTFISLVMHIVGDMVYVLVDPRIDFETREN